MKASSLILATILCTVALAQDEPLMRGHVNRQGFDVTIEMRLEPPTPPFAGGFVGGTVTDEAGIHRHMAYNSLHKFFGYDLQVERQLLGAYSVTIRPLTAVTPASLELHDPASWTTVPLSGYPAPQIVNAGDTIALDLFHNPTTGQKIVDYIRIRELPKPYVIGPGDVLAVNVQHHPEVSKSVVVRPDGFISINVAGEIKAAGLSAPQLSAAIADQLSKYDPTVHPLSGSVNVQVLRTIRIDTRSAPLTSPRDFSLEDVKLRLTAPRMSLNGTPLPMTAKPVADVSGPVVWFYLPGHGRYVLSLMPHPNLGFAKAGTVHGLTLNFTIDGETLALKCIRDIAPGYVSYNIYAYHEPAWRPNDTAASNDTLLGSEESAEKIVPLIDDKIRRQTLPRLPR